MAVSHEVGALGMFLDITGHCMDKKCASSSTSRSKTPVGRGAGHGTTLGGSRDGAHQIRAQTREHTNPQLEIVNGGQPQVASP
ncbi:hypothetical protein HAX54_033010 [Datura stramonium]|uniref:Uncharacterized protein n=1 Tax=Datura stramonium TaxID=4076 RepID=A0ABS8VBJ9_DATST|nr:hypothetical protein [Datura stramonium]